MSDKWKWELIEAWHPGSSRIILAAGECDGYESCRVAMKLLGLCEAGIPLSNGVSLHTCYEFEGKQCFVEYTRLSDGYKMSEWGTK